MGGIYDWWRFKQYTTLGRYLNIKTMTKIEIAGSIMDCIQNAKDNSKELPTEFELMKLKHELYGLVTKIYEDILIDKKVKNL